MLPHVDDTIAAVASAPGGAARGIVRISGPSAVDCAGRLFVDDEDQPMTGIRLACIRSGAIAVELSGRPSLIPAVAYVWPTERSYTRQPTVEFHTLGSPPLLQAILRTACASGARVAQAGEFTLRAFLAGRLDLTQAEAVLGVIDARGEAELRTALAQLAGGLARPLHSLRDEMLDVLAELEAGLDFAEEDIQFITPAALRQRLLSARAIAHDALAQMGGRLDNAPACRAVLLGQPNVGKSSLFNALAGGEHAIVSPVSGTTRDYLAATLHLDGVALELIDTAGEDAAATMPLASAAQGMTSQQRRAADIRIICIDGTLPSHPVTTSPLDSASELFVITKSDLTTAPLPPEYIATSSRSGTGLNELKARLRSAAVTSRNTQVVAGTAARCRESLEAAIESLTRAAELAVTTGHEELIAAELRVALAELGKVVGAVYTDDVLDRIFSRFCIGK